MRNLGAVLKDNPHKFWSYYKAITKSSKIAGVTIKHGSMQAIRPVDQANSLCAFFIQFLLHPIMAALLIAYNDLTLKFNTNCVSYN